jgi:pimeloyl-ACP methyl ester carboxylesterase
VVQLSTERLKKLLPPTPLGNAPGDAKAARGTLRQLLGLPTRAATLDARTISSNTRKALHIEEIVFYSEPYIRVTGWFLRPAKNRSPLPTILYIPGENKDDVVYETSPIGNLARKGFGVYAVDLRGRGDSIPRGPSGGPLFHDDPDALQQGYAWAGFALGKPVLGQRVWDLLRCLDYLQSRSDVDRNRIVGLGVGDAALAVLLAGVLDDRLHSVLLDGPTASYQSVVESKAYSLRFSWFLYGVLKHFDLPDLVGLMAPRTCWILNATSAEGETLAESALSSLYKNSTNVFRQLNAERQLRLMVYPDTEKITTYDAWLSTA